MKAKTLLIPLLLAIVVSFPMAQASVNVWVDVKPGSCPNSINPNSKGVIPVAIQTTPNFDAATVDPTTVVFLGASPLRWTIEDVMRGDGEPPDGDLDLLLFFKTQDCDFSLLTGNEALLTGELFDGTPISGIGYVRLVPKAK